MSFLTGTGGLFGPQFQAQNAKVIDPTTGYAQSAIVDSQRAINQQQALQQALAQQGGLQNQSNVYNSLGNIANGQGPNPAAAMLAQQTGANVSNQAALMAGQRGASANPGLIARQAAQQGANTQQQAVGQAATLQAQQSLNALGQQAGIAGQQVQNQIGNQQSLTGANQAQEGTLIGANDALNSANISNISQQNAANAGIAQSNTGGGNNLISNVTGAVGSAFGLKGVTPPGTHAYGGEIHSSFRQALMAEGGKVPALVSPGEKYLSPKEVEKVAEGKKSAIGAGETIKGKAKVAGDSLKNDTVHKTLTEGGIVLPRSVTQSKTPGKAAQQFVDALLKKQGRKA